MLTLTKQTITGGDLETGDLVAYVGNYIVKCSSTGAITAKFVSPFPPYGDGASAGSYVSLGQLKYSNGDLPVSISKFTASAYGIGMIMFLQDDNGYLGVQTSRWSKSAITSLTQAPGDILIDPLMTGENTNITNHPEALTALPTMFFTDDYHYKVGLGKYLSGAPNFTFVNSTLYNNGNAYVYSVDAQYCKIIDNSVQCYGFYDDNATGDWHILLDNINGYVCHKYTIYIGEIEGQPGDDWVQTAFETIQLAIPSGGEIKQFANGYYIASDSGSGLFLYSINNGGTLIDELSYGTYNPDLPLEFFNVV
jgi:hypothetical protein